MQVRKVVEDTFPTDPVSVVSCLMATDSSARGSHKADNHRHGVGGDWVSRTHRFSE